MKSDNFSTFPEFTRLWIHECSRVISDRFFTTPELDVYESMVKEVMKKQLAIANVDEYFAAPINFTGFATSAYGSWLPYVPVPSMEQLRKVVDTKLLEYNESNAMMDLVLFSQVLTCTDI